MLYGVKYTLNNYQYLFQITVFEKLQLVWQRVLLLLDCLKCGSSLPKYIATQESYDIVPKGHLWHYHKQRGSQRVVWNGVNYSLKQLPIFVSNIWKITTSLTISIVTVLDCLKCGDCRPKYIHSNTYT